MFLVISCFKSESFIVINILTIFQNGIEYFLSTWFQQACVTPFVKKVLSSSLLRLNQKKVVSLTLFRGDNFNFDSNQIKGSCAAVVRSRVSVGAFWLSFDSLMVEGWNLVGVWGILRKKNCRDFRPDINRKWAKNHRNRPNYGENRRKLYFPNVAIENWILGIKEGSIRNILRKKILAAKWGRGVKIGTQKFFSSKMISIWKI